MKVEVSHKFATPKSLVQQYCFVPAKHKDCYLAYVLNEFAGQTILVFAATCNSNSMVSSCGIAASADKQDFVIDFSNVLLLPLLFLNPSVTRHATARSFAPQPGL